MPIPSRSSARRRPLLLAGLVVAALVVWFGKQRLDRWLHPWADTSSGKPVLLGSWVGRLTTGGGRPRVVFMQIERYQVHRSRRSRCRNCDDRIQGRVLSCDERGRIVGYTLDGQPEDRDAARLHGTTQPAQSPPPDGLAISHFRGGWDGADALNLELEFYWRRGASAVTSSGDPDTKGSVPLPLRRSNEAEFEARCREIRGPAIAEVVP